MAERTRLTAHEIKHRAYLRELGLLLDNQPFRQFVWTILTEARIFAPTYTPGSTADTAYHEGRRSLGLEVLHILNSIRPDTLAVLEQEGAFLANARKPPAQSQEDDNDPDPDLP